MFPSYSGRRVVARTLPLDLRGQPRSLGRAWNPDRDRARLTVPAPPGTRPIPWMGRALSGRWLVFTAGARRLMAWRSPAEGAVELPVRVPGTIMSLATAG